MTSRFFKVKYKGQGDKRVCTGFFELAQQTATSFIGRRVNKEGDYTESKITKAGYEDSITIISNKCIKSISEVIHDYKYCELVLPEEASQNKSGWGVSE